MLYIKLYDIKQFEKPAESMTRLRKRRCPIPPLSSAFQTGKGSAKLEQLWIGPELRSLNNLICRYFDFSSHKNEIETVTGNNGWIIGYLASHAQQDIFQRDLEQHFSITRSTASKVLHLMEQKGLIQRQPVARDARLKKIILTEKAWQIKGMMREDAQRMEQTLTNGFTEEEVRTLYSYIKRMKTNLSGVKPGT